MKPTSREYIDANRERMQRGSTSGASLRSDFVDVLTAKSAGNFMYLVHVLRDISGAS